jgi:hypothetical protein
VTKLGDLEAGQFADDLISLLTEAGWKLQTRMVGTFSPPVYGLQCQINEGSPAGKALALALGELPTVHIESAPNMPIVGVVFVGLKPPP